MDIAVTNSGTEKEGGQQVGIYIYLHVHIFSLAG
jgi:hypothetical protein